MDEFLRQNKDLFSSKREFLTKLREVRQKVMNTKSTTPTGTINGIGASMSPAIISTLSPRPSVASFDLVVAAAAAAADQKNQDSSSDEESSENEAMKTLVSNETALVAAQNN
jgi:hypothetical protein